MIPAQPAPADFTDVITDQDAPGYAAATDVAIERITTIADSEGIGWGSETNAEGTAWIVSWTWESRTRGPRPQAVTVLQAIVGGRVGGEGWAQAGEWVLRTRLSAMEAETLLMLAAQDALPRLARRDDL